MGIYDDKTIRPAFMKFGKLWGPGASYNVDFVEYFQAVEKITVQAVIMDKKYKRIELVTPTGTIAIDPNTNHAKDLGIAFCENALAHAGERNTPQRLIDRTNDVLKILRGK